MKTLGVLAVLAASGTLSACGDSTPKRPTQEQDVAAIMEFNKHYLGAINNGDIKTLAALTTDGHVMIAPNRPPIVGNGFICFLLQLEMLPERLTTLCDEILW